MKLSISGVSTIFALTYWVYQGFMQINELITELLTTFIAKNTMYNWKNMESKLIESASCTERKHVLLVVENAMLVP
jgi:hypothetical protein